MALPEAHDWHDENNFRIIRVLARLKPSVTPAAVESELRAIVRSAAPEEPPQFVTMRQGMQILVAPLRNRLVGDIRSVLVILQAVVGMVLLIGCLNIANLQIARAISRQKEMALRVALGAARTRLARQLVTESLLLSSAGGSAGLLLGFGAIGYVRAFLPSNLHLAATVQMDVTVLAFTAGLAVLSGIVTGLAPSLAFSMRHPEDALKRATGRASESIQHHRMRGALVVAEIAIAMVLLAGAGLLTRSFLRLTSVDLGFDPQGVLTVRIPLPDRRYDSPQARVAFFSQLLERSRAIPGVRAAALGAGLPLIGSPGGTGVVVDGRPLPPIGGAPTIAITPVSPEYFETLRIPLMRGRAFSPADRYGAPLVLIVNEAFAKEFFPGEEVLGSRLRFSGVRPGPPREIVGVVGNVRQEGLQKADLPVIYAPFLQIPNSEMLLILRSGLPGEALTAEARRIIQRLDPDQPVADVASMDERINGALGAQRANMILMAIFAGLALSLAASGIFGVVAYLVTRRSHEMGIRLALGAQPADVLKLVFQQGMRWAVAGISLGIVGALLGTRAIRNLLYETSAHDPLTLVIVSGIFGLIAMAACYLPARQASRIDPVITLRQE
jgi:putative ABC transport system permease protein